MSGGYKIPNFRHSPHTIPTATAANDGSMSSEQAVQLAGLVSSGIKGISLVVSSNLGTLKVLNGQLLGTTGLPEALVDDVILETLAKTATQGTLAISSGTQVMNSGSPAGKTSQAVVTTNADGTFQFSVADTAGTAFVPDFVQVRATRDNARVAQMGLRFTGGE